MKNYCTQLIQQQTGSVRWRRLDDIVTRFRHSYEKSVQGPMWSGEHTLVCKFASCCQEASIVTFASDTGRVEIYDLKTRKSLCHFWPVEQPIFDFAWVPGKMHLLAPGTDQHLNLWDVSGAQARSVGTLVENCRSSRDHYEAITSVAISKENPHLCAYGVAGQGQIEFWDTRTFKNRIGVIYETHRLQTGAKIYMKGCVTGLAFRDVTSVVSCAGNDDNIKMWDFRNVRYDRGTDKPTPKQTFTYKGSLPEVGFSGLAIDDCGLKLYANCTDRQIYCFNVNSSNPEPIMKYQDLRHSCQVPYDFGSHVRLALSKDGSYILNGCCDNSAFIWDTNLSYPVVKLNHNYPVRCVAWQQTYYDQVLVTCDSSQFRNVWRIATAASDSDPNFDVQARYKDISLCPEVPYQLRLTHEGTSAENSIRPCKKCFNASTDVYCKKCVETQVTKFFKRQQPHRFSPYTP